jgi:hypothetical protein
MDPKRIEAIKSWPVPMNILGVSSFMGLSSYNKTFIASFSNIVHPIKSLQKKGVEFEWNTKFEYFFHKFSITSNIYETMHLF